MLEKLEQSLAATYQRILDLENPVRVTIDRETGRIYVYELIRGRWTRSRRGAGLRGARRHARRRLPHRRTGREERHRLDHPRRRARADLRRVRRPRGRERHRDRPAVRQPLHAHQAPRGRRGAAAAVDEQPNNERYDHNQRIKAYIIDVRKTSGNEPVDRRVAHASRPDPPPLRARGARDLRRHRRDQERGARAGHAQQGRRLEPRERSRPGRRVRRPQGQPRAHGRGRAARRAHRRRCRGPKTPRPTSRTRCRPRRSTACSSTRTPHTATVIVPDDQLSLAIGKEGQNARLAAKLTGWRIDIKSSSIAAEQGLYVPSAKLRSPTPVRSSTAGAWL